MTILRWILVTASLVAFLLLAVANWTPVPFRLPDGVIVSIHLPMLLAAAFAAGWLPTWLFHLGAKANWKRKLAKYERVGDFVAPPGLPPLSPSGLPSQAQPGIVPPAGA
ncbi:hypothetical protein GCM10011529_16650 [Polymorphobacter glacialis]|uniref:DUF1049 domain-containing protein n=1 Tax=Sandarakinorhabdus glacialis TaxID=1614636 RepID=A0A917E8F3_9SPHN|nr:hypothetical protein [Polymorphobacter glacialis]GGE10945.1 hypothetical protein GCM10011529_16650 [Polymorphobacter glacialis]